MSIPRRTDRLRELARVAESQHGPLSREQLHDADLGDSAIARLVDDGVLRRVHPRVYAFGHRALARDGVWRAALLAGGPEAALSHLSAAIVHRLGFGWARRPHILVPRDAAVRDDVIAAHRCRYVEADVAIVRGLRVTTPMRTLIDLADVVTRAQLSDAFDQAMLRGVYDHRELLGQLARARGRRGVKRLHDVLARIGDAPPGYRSRNERRAHELVVAAGLLPPLVNAAVEITPGVFREADLWWPQLRLDVEIDGPHHRLPHRRRLDAIRDAELRRVGVVVLRIPEEMLDADPDAVIALIARAIAGCVEQRP